MPRPIRCHGLHRLDDWLVKLYGIAMPGDEPRPELLEAALATAHAELPRGAQDDGRHGIGFVIAHQAADFSFALVAWWFGENEIHQRVFSAGHSFPITLRPHHSCAIGCVWELGVTDFERRAWMHDVLANPAGPDLALYLTRELNDDI